MADIEAAYAKLTKTYALPSYKDLNHEFEISSIESELFLIRSIRSKMVERIESFLDLLSAILQPDTTISDLHECKSITDGNKETIFAHYIALMRFYRTNTELSLRLDDKLDAQFIITFYNDWVKRKGELIPVVVTLKDSWKQSEFLKDDLGYLG